MAVTAGTNTGVGNPASEINYTSGLNPMIALIQSMIGSKETGTSKSTEGTVTGGDRAALDALLAKLMGPSNLDAIVSDLFAKGAAQVPALTTQFANATGTRTTNNSMLAQSLAGLNTNLSSQIAQYAVQQQNAKDAVAAQVAGKIADTTRTQTTNKEGTTEKATAPNISLSSNPLGTIAGLGFPLAGFLANKMGKKGEPTSASSGSGSGGSPDGVGAGGEVGGVQNLATPINTTSMLPITGFDSGGMDGISSGVQIPGINIALPSPAIAAPNTVDTSSAIPFDPVLAGFDATDFSAKGFNFDSDLFGDSGFFDAFANGGLVGRRIVNGRPGYADGGQVRNKNYLRDPGASGPVIGATPALQIAASQPAEIAATPSETAIDTEAVAPAQVSLSFAPPPQANVGEAGTSNAPSGPTPKGPNGLTGEPIADMAINKLISSGINELLLSSGALDSTIGAGAAAGAGEAALGAGAGEAAAVGVGEAAAAGSVGGPVGMGIAVAVALLMNAMNKDQTKAPSFGLAAKPDGSFGVTQENYMQGFDPFWGEIDSVINSGIYDKEKLGALSGPRDVYATPGGTAANLFKSIDTARTGNFDNAWFKDWNDRASGATAPYVNTTSGTSTGEGFSDGGKVVGKGTPTSDSIPINVSRDEYILPADVVKYIGVDMLDNLVATIHKPVAGSSQRA